MIKKIIQNLVIVFSILLSSSPFADEAFNLQHLQELFNKYQRKASYDYALKYLDQMEGDPYFDYVYGVSAIDTGHASQGVFALERVLLTFPDDHVARLELARGYFILEEYARSREEFERVLAVNPPKEVQQTTQQFLDQIRLKEARYRTTSSGFVALGMGSDSNVNSGADNDSLTIIQLAEESLGQDDTFSEITAAWQIAHPFSPGWISNVGITAALRMNQDHDEFDTTTATLQAGVSRIFKQSRYKGELLYQQYQLDGNDYRDLAGLNLEWHYSLNQQSRLTSALQYVALDYPDQETRNSDLATLALTYTRSFTGAMNPTLFATFNIGTESADVTNANTLADTERDILGIRVGSILGFTPRLALQLSAGIQTSEYAGPQTFPLFAGITREDDLTTAELNLLWLFHKDWRLDTKFNYTDNSSNVEIYTYDRTVFSVTANYAF